MKLQKIHRCKSEFLLLGYDGFPIWIEQRSETTAVSAMNIEVIHSGFLVNDDNGVSQQAYTFFFFNVESIFSPGFCIMIDLLFLYFIQFGY